MAESRRSDPDVWVDQHGDALFRYAMLRLRDATLAEDAVQETFLAALQSRERFAGRSSERTWLVGILKHKIVDAVRRQLREQPADDLERMPEGDLELFEAGTRYFVHELGPKDWGADPATALERARFWAVLEGCLSGLPPRMASAFTLRELEEMNSEEVCKVLGVTPTNLWVLLHRARAHLRLCLENRWVGKGAP